MAITMYDLAGEDPNRRFSPFCWRTKLALAHKGLEVETIPWRFTEKQVIAKYNWERVPVIIDNGRAVVDSWAIAKYLEEAYPQKPSLFGGGGGQPLARFYNQWADAFLHPAMARFVVMDIFNAIDPRDRDYFRKSREARFGMTLEEFGAEREKKLDAFRQSLEPLRQTLAEQPFLSGDQPLYPDYIVFGSFLWPRSISPFVLLDSADPISKWRERMLDKCSFVRKSPGY